MTNDEKNKSALSILNVFVRLKKKDNNKKKKEVEKRTDEKKANKLDQRNFNVFDVCKFCLYLC